MDKFGSPSKDDPTAVIEQDAQFAAEETNKFIRDSGEFVLNRPPGDKPVSQEDQHIEWELAMMEYRGALKYGGDVEQTQLWQAIERAANLVGPENALAEFFEWSAKHQKMGPVPEPPPPPPPPPPEPAPPAPPAMPMNGAQNGPAIY